ncbi:gamma-glutamyltransferase [Acaryochloris thomasi]|nr:gamma-glutamyltransferase [Acaryochloris thomasi]
MRVAIATPTLVLMIIGADILLSGSLYHPLTYLHQLTDQWNCRQHFFNACQSQKIQKETVTGQKGVVVTAQAEASEVGLQVLQQGGNAIDAAVAVGYALAVTHPCCGNLGGGGFMLIRLADGRQTFINFRERAPLAATPDMYLDPKGKVRDGLSTKGYLAVGVPGTVKGLEAARERYGTWPRQRILAPAISLAKQGFVLSQGDVDILNKGIPKIKRDHQAADIFMDVKGRRYRMGNRLVQKDLSQTLQKISTEGEAAFYRGPIAQQLVNASQQQGGLLTLKDLQEYEVTENPPLQCRYRSYDIVTAPLPGGGITLCQMLNIVEGYEFDTSGPKTSQTLHPMLSAMLFAFADRNTHLGDPRFHNSPVERLLSKDYAAALRAKIPEQRAVPPASLYEGITAATEGTHTTHYSVIDSWGNAVAVTYTINSYFGAGVIPNGTGFFLNNEMDDFTLKPGTPNSFGLVQGLPNQIQPGKQPLSSMSPTMVLKNNQLKFVTGSPGGSTIPTTVLQTITNYIDFKMDLADAVNAPKVHYQGRPNFVFAEPYALESRTIQDLWEMGYRVVPFPPWGAAETAGNKASGLQGIHDHRRPAGKALAY